MDSDTIISTLAAADIDAHLGELAALLHACVHDGASIGFVLPHSATESAAFWVDKVRPGVQAGSRVLLVAFDFSAFRKYPLLMLALPSLTVMPPLVATSINVAGALNGDDPQ